MRKARRICKIREVFPKRVVCAVLCALTLPFILTGCMPYQELKEESIVEGMGIDYGPGGYTITFQIYNAKEAGGGGGGGGGKQGSSSTVTLLQSSGATLFDAVRNVTLQVGRKLYFSETRAYVVSEEVCNHDFNRLLDFMERNQQIRPGDRLIIAKCRASDVMGFKSNGEIVPALNLHQMMDNYIQTSKIQNVKLFDIFQCEASGTCDPTAAAVAIEKNEKGPPILQMDGSAVFHDNKIAGFLNKDETRGCLWISGKADGGVVTVALPDGGQASLEIVADSSKIKVSGDEKKPVVKVDITLASDITEVEASKKHTLNSKFLSELSDLQKKLVADEAQSAINRAFNQFHADIFGFGTKIFEDMPEVWRKLGPNWSANLKKLKVEVTVDSRIRHVGLTGQTG